MTEVFKFLNPAKYVQKLLSLKKSSPTNAGEVSAVIALSLVKKYLLKTDYEPKN